MKKIFLTAMTALCFCAGALYAEKMPDWVKGKGKQYPKESYITGVGSGETLDAARSSARAEIAKFFGARVAQLAKDAARETKKASKKSSEISFESQVYTQVSTDELLVGSEIPETWFSEKKKTYFALAVINRPKLSQELSLRILEAEEAQKAKMSQAKGAASSLERLKLFGEALKSIKDREEAVARKKIIDRVAAGDISSSADRAELEKLKNSELSKILFVINTGKDAGALQEVVGARVSGLGFKVLEGLPEKTAKDVSYIIVKCGMEINPLDKGGTDWKFYEWSARGFISDFAVPGENLAVISRRGQASHLTDEAAKSKAASEASVALAEEVEQWTNKYIYGK